MSDPGQQTLLSPRSFLQIFTNGFEQLVKQKSSQSQKEYKQDFTKQYSLYLASMSSQFTIYKRHLYNRKKQQSQQSKKTSPISSTELKLQFKGKIPQHFFQEIDELEICKKSELFERQQTLTEYLDDIQLLIFSKLSKYPAKSFSVISNVHEGYEKVQFVSNKLKQARKQINKSASYVVKKHKKVVKLFNKSQKIKKILQSIQFIKKMKKLKELSHYQKQVDRINTEHYEFMQNIRVQDLAKASRINSLRDIASQIEVYREAIKNKITKQFESDLGGILKTLVNYSKDQWLNNDIPNNAFTVLLQNQDRLNCSVMNISVLQQSLFDIQQNNQPSVAEIEGFCKFCAIIDMYSIWEDIEVPEIVIRNLLKNNVRFNRDLDDYISHILQQKGIRIQKSRSKYDYIQMRFYFKLVKVYLDLTKQVLGFIKEHRKLFPFLIATMPKIYEFIIGRIKHFLQLKPINQSTSKDDLYHYLCMIQYWVFEQELYQQLKPLKRTVVQQHLTCLHTNILVNQLRTAVERSSFTAISVPSEYYVTLQFILNWSINPIQKINSQALQMSISFIGQTPQFEETPKRSSTFKVINKVLIVQGKSYRVCDSFLNLLKYLEHYIQLYLMLQDLRINVEQKIFEVIGSFIWYNKKILMPDNDQKNSGKQKSVRSICVFLSTIELIRSMVVGFQIENPKKKKLVQDIEKCFQMVKKEISLVPLLMLQEQVQILYQSRISQRKQIPTSQTAKIIEILKSGSQCLKQFFDQRRCIGLMNPSIKMLQKNYFGYLINMDSRGKEQIKWFIYKFKELFGQWFKEDAAQMERQIKSKK